jgi:hypothetical protein
MANLDELRKAQADYEAKIVSRNKQAVETTPEKAVADAGAAGDFKKGAQGTGAQMAAQGASGGDLMGTVGGGLMMTGNPYLMAAGLGLTVLGGAANKRKAEEDAQRAAYNERIKNRQIMMQNIAQQGIQ